MKCKLSWNETWQTECFCRLLKTLLLPLRITSSIKISECVPEAAIQAQAMTLPPQRWTDELICFGSWADSFFLYTFALWKRLILVPELLCTFTPAPRRLLVMSLTLTLSHRTQCLLSSPVGFFLDQPFPCLVVSTPLVSFFFRTCLSKLWYWSRPILLQCLWLIFCFFLALKWLVFSETSLWS